MHRFLILSLLCAAVTAAEQPGIQPALLMGGGNLTNGESGPTLESQIEVLTTLGGTRARINLYPDAYLIGRNWDAPQPKAIDAVMTRLHAAGIRPMLLLEYYARYLSDHKLGTYEQWKGISATFAKRYRPGGDWAIENKITDGFGIDLFTAFNEPEPEAFALGGTIGPKPYVDALRGFADGIHGVDKTLSVAAGGFMAANAWKDWTLRGIGPFLAPLLNDGTLSGIDLHTYYDAQYAPMELGFDASAQNNFDQVKLTCGITRDIDFYSTEFNYKNRVAKPEQVAAGMLTGIWDNLTVVGNDGRTLKSHLALPWNIFNEQKTDGEFGMAVTFKPYAPTPNATVIKLVLELTKGLKVIAADPRGTGMIALRGADRTMWVWQNRNGWTDRPGTSVELCGVPATAKEIEVYGWDGLRKKIAISAGRTVTIEGLIAEQTTMFVVRAIGTEKPEDLLPARAVKRKTFAELRDPTVMADLPGKPLVLTKETFGAETFSSWSAGGDSEPSLALSRVEATPLPGFCAQLSYTFSDKAAGSRILGGGGALVAVTPEAKKPVYLSFLVRSSVGRRSVRVRLSDRDNETATTKAIVAIPAWRRMYIRLDADFDAVWGGDKPNGAVDWPLRSVGFEALSWGGGSPDGGEKLWFSDVQVVQVAGGQP